MYCRICGKVGADTPCCIYCGNRNLSGAEKRVDESFVREPLSELQPPPPRHEPKPKNPIATAALVLSCLAYTAIVGFILGIAGLKKSKKLQGAGKKVSIAAIVVGVIYIASVIIGGIIALSFIGGTQKKYNQYQDFKGTYFIETLEYDGKTYKLGDVFENEILTTDSFKFEIDIDLYYADWLNEDYDIDGSITNEFDGWDCSYKQKTGEITFYGSRLVRVYNESYDYKDENYSFDAIFKDGKMIIENYPLSFTRWDDEENEIDYTLNAKLTLKRYSEQSKYNNEDLINETVKDLADGSCYLNEFVYDGQTYSADEYFGESFYLDEDETEYIYFYSRNSYYLYSSYQALNICKSSIHGSNYSYYGYSFFEENNSDFKLVTTEVTYNGKYENGKITVYGVDIETNSGNTIKLDLVYTP